MRKNRKVSSTFICSELSHKHIFVPFFYLKIDNLEIKSKADSKWFVAQKCHLLASVGENLEFRFVHDLDQSYILLRSLANDFLCLEGQTLFRCINIKKHFLGMRALVSGLRNDFFSL